jgi:hypothetical protein
LETPTEPERRRQEEHRQSALSYGVEEAGREIVRVNALQAHEAVTVVGDGEEDMLCFKLLFQVAIIFIHLRRE